MSERIFINGSTFFIDNHLNKILDSKPDADIERYFADELDKVSFFTFINTISLFGNEKIAYVRNIDKLKSVSTFIESTNRCIESSIILSSIIPFKDIEKSDKEFAKSLKNCNYKLIIEQVTKKDSITNSKNVIDIFQSKGVTISNLVAMEILEITAADLTKISNEAEKISLYMIDNPNTKVEDILSNISGRRTESIYALIDAVGEKKIELALKIFKNIPLNENSNDYRVYYGIAKRISNIYFSYISDSLIDEFQGFVKQKVVANKRFWSRFEAAKMIEKLSLLDLDIKTGKRKFDDALFEILTSIK